MNVSSRASAGARRHPLATAVPPDEPHRDPVDALILDLLDWLAVRPRAYGDVMESWRTSCPRLPVWEEANVRGYVERRHVEGREAEVALSAAGAAHRRAHARQVG